MLKGKFGKGNLVMNFYEHACVVLVWYVDFIFLHSLNAGPGFISYQLNNSIAEKNGNKAKCVREWFLYKKISRCGS